MRFTHEEAMCTVQAHPSPVALPTKRSAADRHDRFQDQCLCVIRINDSQVDDLLARPEASYPGFKLVKAAPAEFRYENALAVASGDYVLLHGRFSGFGASANWIVVDIVRMENGQLAEHWDVIQDEARRDGSKSGLPMFGDSFPD